MARIARREKRVESDSRLNASNDHRRQFWFGALLVLVTLLVFGRAVSFEFTIWDDYYAVASNPQFSPPTLEHTLEFWKGPSPHETLYLPISYSLWAAVAAAGYSPQADGWGIHLNPYLFHATNVVLHIACVLAVWRLIRRLVKNEAASILAAMVFAVHPVQVEPVAWVTGTRDILGMLLSTLAILWFLDFTETSSVEKRRVAMQGLVATLLFVAALLSKPTAVVVPIVAGALAMWSKKTWRARDWGLLLFWMMLSATDAILTRHWQQVDPYLLRNQPAIWFRPFVALDAIAFYIGKLAWPVRLAIDYGRTPAQLLASRQWMWTWIVPAVLLVIVSRFGRRGWICLTVFVTSLLPVLGLMPYRFQFYYGTVADRYLYPAMLGVALLIAVVLSRAGQSRGKAITIIFAVFIATWGIMSFHQLSYWRDSMSLFTRAIEVNPKTLVGRQNRGAVENHDRDFTRAENDFRALLAAHPYAPEGHRGLARSELAQMRVDEGLSDWAKALAEEQSTIDRHGVLASDFKSQLAAHYTEAAEMAGRAGHVEQAKEWRKAAARLSESNADAMRR